MPDYDRLIDAETWAFIHRTGEFYPDDAVDLTIAGQRAVYDRMCLAFHRGYPAGVAAEDRAVGGVPARIYTTAEAPRATVVYFHGGGFVVGGLHSHDDVCAEIAAATGFRVVSEDYRLAPEHRHPVHFDDAMTAARAAATLWGGPLVVAGDSAGGNLAAAVSHAARASGPIIAGQVLIYPGLGGDMSRGSYVTQANAPGLSTADVIYYRDTYRGGGSKYAEPLRETDFSGLPPAFLVAARHDPLHDDCFDYTQRLHAAGVPAQLRDEPLLVHGFLRARNMSAPARASFTAIAAACAALAHDGQLPS